MSQVFQESHTMDVCQTWPLSLTPKQAVNTHAHTHTGFVHTDKHNLHMQQQTNTQVGMSMNSGALWLFFVNDFQEKKKHFSLSLYPLSVITDSKNVRIILKYFILDSNSLNVSLHFLEKTCTQR